MRKVKYIITFWTLTTLNHTKVMTFLLLIGNTHYQLTTYYLKKQSFNKSILNVFYHTTSGNFTCFQLQAELTHQNLDTAFLIWENFLLTSLVIKLSELLISGLQVIWYGTCNHNHFRFQPETIILIPLATYFDWWLSTPNLLLQEILLISCFN